MRSRLALAAIGVVIAAHLVLMSRAPGRYVPVPGDPYATRNGTADDLTPRFVGARELVLYGRSPYAPEVTAHIQRAYYGADVAMHGPDAPGDEQRFAYPIYTVLPLLPLLPFPYQAVLWIYGVISLGIVWLSTAWWIRRLLPGWSIARRRLLLAALMCAIPVLSVFLIRQLAALVYLSFTAAAAANDRGRHRSSGAWLALALIKPQLAFGALGLLGITWLVRRDRGLGRMLVSLAAVMAGVLVGFELWQPGWWREWLAAIRAYRSYAGGATSSLAITLGFDGWAHEDVVGGVVLVLAFAALSRVIVRRIPGPDRACLATLLGLVLATALPPVASMYHQVLILPAVVWLIGHTGRSAPGVRWLARLGLAVTAAGWAIGAIPFVARHVGLTHLVTDLATHGPGVVVWRAPYAVLFCIPFVLLFVALGILLLDRARVD